MGKRTNTYRESTDREVVPTNVADEDVQGDGPKVDDGPHSKRKKFKQNWRINMLSVPKALTPKYVDPPYSLNSGVQKDALGGQVTERTEDLALAKTRNLKVNKKLFLPLRGPKYGIIMDGYIERSWNSIYNYYRKSLHDLKKKKDEKRKLAQRWSFTKQGMRGKKGKGKGKGDKMGKSDSKISEKSRETIMKELDEWCLDRSKPKAKLPPPPVNRGRRVSVSDIKPHQDELAMPKRIYKTPSQSSNYKDPQKVSPAALTYEATARMGILAQPAAHRLLKPDDIIPGTVKPAALTYKISPRMTELAIPKPATIARESDLNEDAFTISPAALKYVASPRILEIAKPKEYSF